MELQRRDVMMSLCAALAIGYTQSPLAATSSGARAIIKPNRLHKGDKIGLVSPGSPQDEVFDYQIADETIRALGLVPKHGKNFGKVHGYFAGNDKERAADVNAMFADKSIKAIMAVRGGWGTARILPYLDFEIIKKNPKPLIGYSDITALHMALQAKTGLVSFHGPNATSAWGKKTQENFIPMMFEGAKTVYTNPDAGEDRLVQRKWRTQTIGRGKARGRLIGGNLTVLTALIGTPFMPDTNGAILFTEDVDEAEYRIDRMLTQLGQAGHLKGIKGFVFGQCSNCKASSGRKFTLHSVLRQHIGKLDIPAFQGAFFGHMKDQYTIPLGIMAELDADLGTIRLLEPAVV